MKKIKLQKCEHISLFSASHDFIMAIFSQFELKELELSLRPILHNKISNNANLSDNQIVNEQLRFYTRQRCMRDFRKIAWKIREKYPQGIWIEVNTSLNLADTDFFSVVSNYVPMRITASLSKSNNKSSELSNKIAGKIKEGSADQQYWRWIRSTLGEYLNYGDSWTAKSLAELIITNHSNIPALVYDVLGLAFALQGDTAQAELLFKGWYSSGGIDQARAAYSLAMLYARHHPYALRNDQIAENYLNEAWGILKDHDGKSEQIIYEMIFNRNGLALILYRQKKFKDSIDILEESIGKIGKTPFKNKIHHSVLLNNLGRVYASAGNFAEAEKNLKLAIKLDPLFAEYWFDLASFYCDYNLYEKALSAAKKAFNCSNSIEDIPALIGYIENAQSNYDLAIKFYHKAWLIEPSRADFILAIIHNLCEIRSYHEAESWLERLENTDLSTEYQEMKEILALEILINTTSSVDQQEIKSKFEKLLLKYPQSEVIRSNIANFAGDNLKKSA